MDELIVVGPGEGEAIGGGPSLSHVKVDIGGLYLTETAAEGMPMIDLHIHKQHSDAFYVLEGEIELAMSAEENLRLGAGGFAIAPPGVPHAFGVPERARFLNIHAPGMAFGSYLRELVAMRGRGEAPSPEFLARFDIHPPP